MQQLSSGAGLAIQREDKVVYVGNIIFDGDYYAVANGFNVRKSGTTKGFGQLAFEGPLGETALDPVPTVLVPKARLCHFIECNDVWKKHIK